MTKYIFITGGVVSGLGKGITAASLGRLLKQRGLRVAVQKLDPYMNIDPGTMNPYQHGEVFVTEDGAETDLDLGHYERFMDENLTKFSTLTSGKVYWNVLERERSGDYQGGTVQVIPHITDAIKEFIYTGAQASGADVLIVEVGGTVGDIEGQPFIEAIRQIVHEQGHENCLSVHVTLVPYLKGAGEHKSKPTQHSVKELRSMGITPDILVVRADKPLPESIKEKLSLFCDVKPDCVIENVTLNSLYEAPLMLHENGLDTVVCRELGLAVPEPDLAGWRELVGKITGPKRDVSIGIVGKYVKLPDAYLSVIESLHHAGFEVGAKVNLIWIDSESVTEHNAESLLGCLDGMVIPGGFGDRGITGKIAACRYAREHDLPLLGICLGMQIMVIEFARNVCGLAKANSSEFDPDSPDKVIDIMPNQVGMLGSGGTMRLGSYPCRLEKGSLLHSLYNTEQISERHRHRFEVNNSYRELLGKKGLNICGISPDGLLVEAVELPGKRFFAGVQFHPEFKSRPNSPHPLFLGLLRAAVR